MGSLFFSYGNVDSPLLIGQEYSQNKEQYLDLKSFNFLRAVPCYYFKEYYFIKLYKN